MPPASDAAHKRITSPRRRKNATREEIIERDKQIIKLRLEDRSNKAIAAALGLPVATIASSAHKLIQKGLLLPQRRGRKPTLPWRNLADERIQTIIRMVKERATLQEMGDVLGCSREWVHRLIDRIKEIHGEAIFESDEVIWTPQEAAAELGINDLLVVRLCRSGEVPTKRRGVHNDREYLIYEEGMRMLRAHPLVTRKKKCVICKQAFAFGKYQVRQITCSDECETEYERQRYKGYATQELTLDSLYGWRRDLWQKLQTQRIPKNEEWLTPSEAAQRTGLSKMQLTWLQHRNIVTIHHDPSRIARRTGKPMALYAASEMEIARRAFKAHTGHNC